MTKMTGLTVASTVLIGAALLGAPLARAAEVYVQVGGGDWADANMKAYVEPFERETGIKVVPVREFLSIAKLKLMMDNKNVELDVADMPYADYLIAIKNGWLEKIDYGVYKPEELSGLTERDRQEYGVAAVYAAYGLAYSTKKYPAGTPHPSSYADLWDVKKFPATRTLRVGSYGSGPWEEALLADGVPLDKLYPIDVDRVFRSLDRIKPYITKWWKEGAEGQQLFADGAIDVGQVFAGRIISIKEKGAPVDLEWNQAKIQIDYWVIPKGAHNNEAAQRFIEFATRAKPQAEWAEMFPNAPSNKNALKYMKPETAKRLPTDPENAKKSFFRDDSWYVATGPDGKTNLEMMIDRWNAWIVQ